MDNSEQIEDLVTEEISNNESNNKKVNIINDNVHNDTKRHKCGQCEKSYMGSWNLKQHIQSVHEGLKGGHQCEICDMSFFRPFLLKSHIKIVHEGVKNHKCDQCDYVAGSLGNLKRHIVSVHEGLKKHKCKSCEYTCAYALDLKRHFSNVHLIEKHSTYYKRYSRTDKLDKHITSVHEGTKQTKKTYERKRHCCVPFCDSYLMKGLFTFPKEDSLKQGL